MITSILLLLLGFVMLTVGADVFVKGASKIATVLGIPPIIIGLTLVAFGTSAPELAVSLKGVWSGEADITVGNVVGSNNLNILLILGLTAIITPLTVVRSITRTEIPLLIFVSGLTTFFAWDLTIQLWEGIILFGIMNIYMYYLYASNKAAKEDGDFDSTLELEIPEDTETDGQAHYAKNISFILLGIALLVFGSDFMVNAAVSIAQSLGMSKLLIGLTIVAIGTSLPEIATSVMAALRGEGDIAVGNIVGSNLFNLMMVLGLTSILSGDGIPLSIDALHLDFPVMLGAAIISLPLFISNYSISRGEGFLYVFGYILYTIALITREVYPALENYLVWAFYLYVGVMCIHIVWALILHQKAKA